MIKPSFESMQIYDFIQPPQLAEHETWTCQECGVEIEPDNDLCEECYRIYQMINQGEHNVR